MHRVPACAGLQIPRRIGGVPRRTRTLTARDIPVTTGRPDHGFEGYRFVGYNLYDALIL